MIAAIAVVAAVALVAVVAVMAAIAWPIVPAVVMSQGSAARTISAGGARTGAAGTHGE
ncbi:MAG TPA: hypothetical protein VH476_02315 [Solirubrobacterales bacterium]